MNDDCHYGEFHFAKCQNAYFIFIIMSVIMLNATMLIVIILYVVMLSK
jgi:hypothetical protein